MITDERGQQYFEQFDIDDPRNCTYFRAWLKSTGVKAGEPFNGYEYSSWIQSKHEEFRKLHGIKVVGRYSPETEKQFETFIGL